MQIEPNDLRKLADEIERDGLRAFVAKRKPLDDQPALEQGAGS